MGKRLAGKIAIVTGASRGIGGATALRLAAEGARVVLVARTLQSGERRLAGSLAETAQRIEALGAECLVIRADLADPAKRSHVVPETVERFGGVDILINNAAWARYEAARDQSSSHIRRCFEINYFAPLELIQQCAPHMARRGAGWIVNVTSTTTLHPSPAPFDREERFYKFNANVGPSIYGSSKAALERLTTGMACELADANIAVNALAPLEAVASEGALALGAIDSVAHMEPMETMVQAVLELCWRPPAELSGRRALSLNLLRELGATVYTLDGRQPFVGFEL
ncbi:MAG TPA: SDR family NAD(P)-dependent oxidoreductase [Steroidobacter sp.]|jgi:NAD(P)-dependent dehydrogenase (short-subunit alcohol dehydrogenase family)|nr:SDR family NAD(P)-dependent oxidoreductase [Steroidobacteraceae bacterium]HLS80499.1 SDR family NAD(P)-dependent oxidoreductase [Steroidobacter sp.]